MSISLSNLSSPSNTRPLIFTIVSDGGMGKTTLASLFPRPVFIRTEDGTQSIADRQDIALFPVASSINEVLEAV
ncbi:MAG TPA: AAA family ATPase, partial [Dehalococcoidales bacterium]|nr:AAA family ATPase [Dehalococcoidales bacterium]